MVLSIDDWYEKFKEKEYKCFGPKKKPTYSVEWKGDEKSLEHISEHDPNGMKKIYDQGVKLQISYDVGYKELNDQLDVEKS